MNDRLFKESDAIKAIYKLKKTVIKHKDLSYHDGLFDALEAIQDLTSADKSQGKWIFRTIFPNDKSEFPMGYLECSICGSTHANKTPCNFCDNCGARMKGITDE